MGSEMCIRDRFEVGDQTIRDTSTKYGMHMLWICIVYKIENMCVCMSEVGNQTIRDTSTKIGMHILWI